MFHDPDLNPSGAQLLFSSHDTSLLDNTVSPLDPSEVWFCEQQDMGHSEVVPLDDHQWRPTFNLQRAYLTGRFETVPRVDLSHLSRFLVAPDET